MLIRGWARHVAPREKARGRPYIRPRPSIYPRAHVHTENPADRGLAALPAGQFDNPPPGMPTLVLDVKKR